MIHCMYVTIVAWCESWVYYAQIFYCYSILEFFHVIPMHVLLLCSYYAHFIIEKTPRTWRGTNVPPTGICLSPLFIVNAVTDGHHIKISMQVTLLYQPLIARTLKLVLVYQITLLMPVLFLCLNHFLLTICSYHVNRQWSFMFLHGYAIISYCITSYAFTLHKLSWKSDLYLLSHSKLTFKLYLSVDRPMWKKHAFI